MQSETLQDVNEYRPGTVVFEDRGSPALNFEFYSKQCGFVWPDVDSMTPAFKKEHWDKVYEPVMNNIVINTKQILFHLP